MHTASRRQLLQDPALIQTGASGPKTSAFRHCVPLLILGAIAAVVLVSGLGIGSLKDWDEAIYAQVSKEIVEGGDWLTLHWNYEPWFQKPPLLMWVTALFYRWFGVSEFWARAASALSGIGVILLTYLIGAIETRTLIGLLAGAILLTDYHFVLSARMGMTDVMLTFFTYLAVYGYLRLKASRNQKWWYLVWGSCALAIMVKSAAGLIPPVTIALALFADRQLKHVFRVKEFWLGLLAGVAICAPWHILMLVQHGKAFTSDYIGYQIVTRVKQARIARSGGPLFYVKVLGRDFFPWFCAVPFAVALRLKEDFQAKSRSWALLLVAAVVFGTCTAVKTKIAQYIIPVYPALALMTSSLLVQAFRPWKSPTFRALLAASTMMAAIAALQFYGVPFNRSALASIARSVPLQAVFVAVFSTLALFVISVLEAIRRGPQLSVDFSGTGSIVRSSAALMCGVFFFVGAQRLAPLYHRPEEPVAHLASLAKAKSPNDREPLIVFSMPLVPGAGINTPAPLFYSNRPTLEAHTYPDLAKFTDHNEWRRIIFEKQDLDSLRVGYDISVVAEADPLVYGMIKNRTMH